MATNLLRPLVLLMLLTAAVVAAGLLTLVGAKPALADLGFAAAPNSPFAVGSAPTTVTDADFDGDGDADLASSNYDSDGVSVLLGNGDGDFEGATGSPFPTGDGPTSVASADLNGDSKADLAVSNETSNSVSVLLGNGDGTFRDKTDLAVGSKPTSVADGDFDGDGDADLAVSNGASNSVSVLLGNGDGTFRAAQPYSVFVSNMINPNQVITDDFDGDGDADLATANVGQNTEIANFHGGVVLLLGNGDGTFQTPRAVWKVFLDYSVTSADFNGDGNSDLATTSYGLPGGCCIYGEVKVMLGNGDGTFQAARTIRVGTGHTLPSAVTSADFDGDAKADLAVSNFATDDVSVLLGEGDGAFQAAQNNFPAGDGPAFVISPDLNADNSADLAVANQNSNNVSVLLNTAPPPSPPPPDTAITSGPAGRVNDASATFGFSSSEPGSTFQCALDDPANYSPCNSPKSVPEQGTLADGSHTFYVKATGAAGSTDPTPATRTWTVDTAAPTVSGVSPAKQAQNTALGTNVEATFSEAMNETSVEALGTFVLKQGASPVAATVSYDSNTNKATLDPTSDLAPNTTYTATVKGGSTGAKDLAGNALAQDDSWSFTTASLPPTSCTKTGTSGNDVLEGTSGDDVICGLGGSDTIRGLGGNDVLRGDAGNDKLFGEAGNDTLDGGTGTNDTANFSGALAAVTASLGTNTATGGEGSDTLAGVESLVGSSKNDTLTGSEATNTISGGGGSDILEGLGGTDKLTGGGGNDTERGGTGNDTVVGSGGADSLLGEDGDDTVNSKDGVNGNDSLDGGAGTDTKVTDATEKSMVGFP